MIEHPSNEFRFETPAGRRSASMAQAIADRLEGGASAVAAAKSAPLYQERRRPSDLGNAGLVRGRTSGHGFRSPGICRSRYPAWRIATAPCAFCAKQTGPAQSSPWPKAAEKTESA